MLAELREDNRALAGRLREVHEMVEEHRDIATASLIESWIDETERRIWFLFESSLQMRISAVVRIAERLNSRPDHNQRVSAPMSSASVCQRTRSSSRSS